MKKIGYFDFALPWPFKDVDLPVLGFGVDLLDQGRILVAVRPSITSLS